MTIKPSFKISKKKIYRNNLIFLHVKSCLKKEYLIFFFLFINFDLRKFYIFFNVYIIYTLLKIIKKIQTDINILFLKKNIHTNILSYKNLRTTSKMQKTKIILLYKKIFFNDKTILRIKYIREKIKISYLDIPIIYNKKNLIFFEKINIIYKGECLIFFLNQKNVVVGNFSNKFYYNNIFLKIFNHNKLLLDYIAIYTDIAKLYYCYSVFFLITLLKQNKEHFEFNIITSLIQHFPKWYLNTNIYKSRCYIMMVENFNNIAKYQKIKKFRNFFIMKIYNKISNLFTERKKLIKNKIFKNFNNINLNLFVNSIITENFFRNLILYKLNEFYNNKKKNHYLEKRFILDFIPQFISNNKNFSFYYLTFNQKKKILTTKLDNSFTYFTNLPLKKKKIHYHKKKNEKKKYDVRNYSDFIKKKRWVDLISYLSLICIPTININTFKQISFQYNKLKHKKIYFNNNKIHNFSNIYLKDFFLNSLLYYIKQKNEFFSKNLI
uniref:Uncharacterized protein n=1 Tax=Lotharella vacuolata TaxID=74820 RepID=A0A0H5BH52_9EUKA|nr:hypothetical protein [Lotharella vacuolata]